MSARKKHRSPWILFIVGTLGIFIVTAFSFLVIHPTIPTRIGVAIVGDPTVVFSYDLKRNTITALSIPSTMYVDVVRGYGAYPVSSLWKLDSMDKRQGVLFLETLEEAVGFPVRFFIDPHSKSYSERTVEDRIQELLSLRSCLTMLFRQKKTNMPPWLYFSLYRMYQGINSADVTIFDLNNHAVYDSVPRADGSEINKIDPDKLNLLLGTHAEDAQIRKENLRLAVYNTTASPGLAQKITRVIETTGFHVVTLGNNEAIQPERCILKTKKENQDSISIQTLQWLYGCVREVEDEAMQEDIAFIIGTEYEKRFLPF